MDEQDGLLPLTEWLGQSPWSERMLAILDDIWKNAPVQTPFGPIVSDNVEINGEMLQTLSRVYWMTANEKYLDWALRLGDYYLLGSHHPTRDMTTLRLRDHGCEIISGLCELYASVSFARPEKKQAYQKPIHEMLDRILEIGRNEHGLFYNSVNPRTAEHSDSLADTWGYDLNGFYTVYLIDKTESFRQAAVKALACLNDNYRNYNWEGNFGADGYADSIESAINLYNREPVPSAAQWIDSQTNVMWQKQQPDGIIEGWHGDGNFARTTIMYCLWKTLGLTIRPWREDVSFGAVRRGSTLKITISADSPWQGDLIFDSPRHRTNMHLPIDWPRINQFPEWFTVADPRTGLLENITTGDRTSYTASRLQQGVPINLKAGTEYHLRISPDSKIELAKNDSAIIIKASGKNVLQYNCAPVPPPQGASDRYTRGAFIHPLWSPNGSVLTDIHPPDHMHHMGIWMPWTKTEFQGRKVDFWNLAEGQGTVRFTDFISTTAGPIYGGFVAKHDHIDLSAPDGPKTALNETWDLRVYNLDREPNAYWLWDLVSTQHCASQSPLKLLKYRYGGIGFRAARQWQAPDADCLTSEGKTRKDGNATRARWCDVYGPIDQTWAGLTVFSHPLNFRHPEPMRIWPEKNKYVFFNFAPTQLGDWSIEPGTDYVFRYRFCVHQGKPDTAVIERLWNDFADPPKISFKPGSPG